MYDNHVLFDFYRRMENETTSTRSTSQDATDYLNSLSANCTAWLLERNRTASDFDDDGLTSLLETEENPSYFSRDYRIVGTFFQGLILLVGVLGNLLVVLVIAYSHLSLLLST